MPTPEEEFAALSDEQAEFERLDKEPVATPTVASKQDIPWYRSLAAGMQRNVMGNLGNKLADVVMGAPEEREGIPATYAGSTPGETLEKEYQQQREAHPIAAGIGQAALGIPIAVASGAAGGALGGAAGSALGNAAGTLGGYAGGVVGEGVGAGAGAFAPYAAETFNEQTGSPGERLDKTGQFMHEHPVLTGINAAGPLMGELAAPVAQKVGQKMVDAGNRGLARLALGAAERGRLRGLKGEEGLAELGQNIRDAGLDKGRNLAEKLTPTDANRLAENSYEKMQELGGPQGKITGLEDDILASQKSGTVPFGKTQVSTQPVTEGLDEEINSQMRGRDLDALQTIKALQRQKAQFPSPGKAEGYTVEQPEPGMVETTDVPVTKEPSIPLEDAIHSRRKIAERLFDTKDRALKPTFGADKAREIAYGKLSDIIKERFGQGMTEGVLDPNAVRAYRDAQKDFSTAATIGPDAAKRAETELKAGSGLLKTAMRMPLRGAPGTSYNLGRLVRGVGNAEGVTAGGMGAISTPIQRAQEKMPDAPQSQVEESANDEMKQNLWQRWYNKVAPQ